MAKWALTSKASSGTGTRSCAARSISDVRSRGRGLLALPLFGDVGPQDAPTRLVSGSHLYVPEFLAPYGEDETVPEDCYWRPSVLCRPMVRDGFAVDGSDPAPVARAIVAGLMMAAAQL